MVYCAQYERFMIYSYVRKSTSCTKLHPQNVDDVYTKYEYIRVVTIPVRNRNALRYSRDDRQVRPNNIIIIIIIDVIKGCHAVLLPPLISYFFVTKYLKKKSTSSLLPLNSNILKMLKKSKYP